MKHSLFYYFNKVVFKVSIPVFYKRILIRGEENLNLDKPYMVSMNHPNSFMDPIAFATFVKPPMRFLARGDAFKPGLKKILSAVGIIPIFRIKDFGRDGVQKNDETFRLVIEQLRKNNPVIIFAEGISIQERRLRPLKKGCARIALGAIEEFNNTDVFVVPVGVNYQNNPSKFRHDIYIEIGKPVSVGEFRKEFHSNKVGAINHLTLVLQEKMKETVIHIQHPENDELIEQIEELILEETLDEQKYKRNDLKERHEFTKKLCYTVNQLQEEDPDKMISIREKFNLYFNALHVCGIRDKILRNDLKTKSGYTSVAFKFLALITGLPIWLAGVLTNYVPYYISWKTPGKIVKDIEWYASFAVVGGTYVFMLYHLLQFSIVASIIGNWIYTAYYILITVFSGWFCLHYSPFRKKLFGSIRLLRLKKNQQQYNYLVQKRNELIEEIHGLLNKDQHLSARAGA